MINGRLFGRYEHIIPIITSGNDIAGCIAAVIEPANNVLVGTGTPCMGTNDGGTGGLVELLPIVTLSTIIAHQQSQQHAYRPRNTIVRTKGSL